LARYCKDSGIGCAYHAGDYDFQEGGAQINALAAGTKENVHFVLDAGEGVADFLAKNSRRVDSIHLTAGQAESDWEPLKKAMAAASQWHGWLVIADDSEKQGGEVGPAREALRRMFGV